MLDAIGLNEDYLKVNEALCNSLLDGRYNGRALYLTLDAQARVDVASALDLEEDDVDDYCGKVVGTALDRDGNPYRSILRRSREWSWRAEHGNPPFVALLFALSHAAELMAAEGDLAPNNYYKRLAQATGFPAADLKKHGRKTDELWRALATYLAENDYELGRPSAQATGTWRYVGLAMSQAVVRSSDREHFHDLFETYGFTEGEKLGAEDLRPYLENWFLTSKPGQRLKQAWQKPDLRERVCEAAAEELQDWVRSRSSSSAQRSTSSSRRLTLIAAITPSFPTKSLALNLSRPGEGLAADGVLETESGQRVALDNSLYGSTATLSPNLLGKSGEGMARNIKLSGASLRFVWSPRPAIPLADSSEGPFWAEVSRTTVGQVYMVLVRDKKKTTEDFEVFLSEATDGAAKLVDPTSLRGIPTGWKLYTDVLVTRGNVNVPGDLEHLVPLPSGNGFTVSGGMQLARGVWHSCRPPGLHLSTEKGPARIELERPRIGPQSTARQEEAGRHCSWTWREPGNWTFVARGYQGGKLVAETDVLLRSSNKPRPLHRQSAGALGFGNWWSAGQATDGQRDPVARGHVVVFPAGVSITGSGSTLSEDGADFALPLPGEEEEAPEDFAPEEYVGEAPESCAARGYHHWICESPATKVTSRTPLRMDCKDCGASVLLRNRGNKAKVAAARRGPPRPAIGGGAVAKLAEGVVDHDILLDALGFLGNGPTSKIEGLLSDVALAPWQLRELVSGYVALGLLDVEYLPGSGRPARWSVPPPALVLAAGQGAVLSGFRNEDMVDDLEARVAASAGRLEKEQHEGQPSTLRVKGLDSEQLRAAIDGVEDSLGRQVQLVEDFAGTVLEGRCHLECFAGAFSPIAVGQEVRNLQFFDARSARWRAINHLRETGAYRFDHHGRTYVYRAEDGHCDAGPHQLVKLLAARNAGIRLHGYEASTGHFVCTRGAEPVGLLERALVSCSGRLPVSSRDGLTSYANVPPSVAEAVIGILYKEEIDR